MKSKLLVTTAVMSLALGAGFASAQDRTNDRQTTPQTTQQQRQQQQHQTTGQTPAATQSQPSTQTQNTPATSQRAGSASQPSSAQNSQPPSSQQPSSAQSSQPATNQPSSAQSTQPSTNQPAAAQSKQPATSNQPSSAQTTQPSTTNQPSSAQSNQPATTRQPSAAQTAPSTQTQQPATAQQQPQGTTNNVRISASLQTPQRTRLNEAVTRLDVRPVSNVNFSVSIGTAVPTSVSLHPLPTTIVEIIPQYRGYDYFVVRDEVVIVEPRTHKIVDVIERRGAAAHAQSTKTDHKVSLSKQDREVIRKHRTTRSTTGSATRTRTTVKVGDELPESVEIHTFSDDVYREVPSVREYRYIDSDRGTYLVEPRSRRVIEEIDAD